MMSQIPYILILMLVGKVFSVHSNIPASLFLQIRTTALCARRINETLIYPLLHAAMKSILQQLILL